ncbi:non-ribosomal peptide synthetase [Streptomyces sp. V3I7]|uniref:non-ribosomal peptide synthetase n=1 Tax=Streptomyces sp. V3I7 TaxID=3042278 RepID=UPI0027D92C2D|nr:non-ribosomal peptide synthetase [Streptomyces sp. V3I7]
MSSEAEAEILTPADSHPGSAFTQVETPLGDISTGHGAPLSVSSISIPVAFSAQARITPDRVAVSGGGVGVSYGELDAWSSLLAGVLAEAGVGVGDRVGVCLERGVELIVALLGVLKAGAVYVPLDASYPVERLGFVVEDTGVEVVVGDRLPAELAASVRVVDVHAQPTATDLVLPVIDPRSPAYVIHTSGSTGRPKGVLVSHRNVMALLAATRTEFALDAGDVWSFFHSFAFDFSVWEIWGCLLTGGRLVVVDHWSARDPEEFHALLAREQVTVLSQTPSAFSQLTRAETFTDPGQELAVRLLIFGGEPLDTATLLPWMDRYPPTRCRAVNMYGITETTVHCTWHTLTRADALTGSRSVGRPLPGWQLHLLDDQQRPLPLGTPGEIYVGGAGVSLGYHNRPELTAERFLPDPHNLGHTLYRTGDLGRYQDDGTLEHLGRLDDQVKIRGHRIEPAEIRTTLLDDTDVRAAAVVVRGAGTATARLDAYVVTAPDADPAQIKQRTAGRLPAHLVPATLTTVPELPLTTNGKLDTARLPDPLLTTPTPQTTPQAPGDVPDAASGDEDSGPAALAAVWRQVIGVPVGPDDNFFELGGNSLLAVQLNAALRKNGFPDVRLRDIFRHSTPRRLAAAVESRGGSATNASKPGGVSA